MNQEGFIKRITNKYTLSTLPHSIILLGDEGSGHEDVCKALSDYYGLMCYDMTESINTDYINQIYLVSNQSMYLVDLNRVTEKEQNVLLKLFEEPNPYTYVILYGESLYNVLDTIQNRGQVFYLDKYTTEYLKTLVTGDVNLTLSVCNTPGQIEIANHTNLEDLSILCGNIINKMSVANFANTMTISNKINFRDEYSKYDLRLFIRMLGNVMVQNGKYEEYKLLAEMSKVIIFMNDKRSYFDNFLIKLWKLSRGILDDSK